MITPLHDSHGNCRGFLAGNTVYSRNGRPAGEIRGRWVFDNQGTRIGELQGQTIVAIERVAARPVGSRNRFQNWLAARLGTLAVQPDPFDRLELKG